MVKKIINCQDEEELKRQIGIISRKIKMKEHRRGRGIMKLKRVSDWAQWARNGAKETARERKCILRIFSYRYPDRKECNDRMFEQFGMGQMAIPNKMLEKYPFISSMMEKLNGNKFNPFETSMYRIFNYLKGVFDRDLLDLKDIDADIKRLEKK